MKFLRRNTTEHLKLGKKRKKKQKWRKPKGRDNKMREKRKGYPKTVSVGHKKNKKLRDKINGKTPIIVYNVKELEKIGKGEIVIIGKVGKRKRLEILKKAQEKKIPVYNVNKKFLEKLKKENES